MAANDPQPSEETAAPWVAPPWLSWKDVPADAHRVAAHGPWFVEVFSGTARLTQKVAALGIPCLPPIDVTLSECVPEAFDVVDADRWDFFMQLVALAAISFAHFGTPCNTLSAARKDDGGPPPLRSAEHPWGLPDLDPANAALLFLGNLFLIRTAEACELIVRLGGNFSVENPLRSMLWTVPAFVSLARETRALTVVFDQCMFKAPSMKPTQLLVSHEAFQSLAMRCDGRHPHEALKGKVWSDRFQRWVFRTKLAQEYPWPLCEAMAEVIRTIFHTGAPQFQLSYHLTTKGLRKRPLGQRVVHRDHRQKLTALMAQASGYQLKRGAMKPLLDMETEPGVAIEWALSVPHPLTAQVVLEDPLVDAINAVSQRPDAVLKHRISKLEWWSARAVALIPATEALLQAVPDVHLRRLLRGAHDHAPLKLGSFCHVALYRELLQAVNSCDQSLPSALLNGFPIVGPIARSGRWPEYEKAQEAIPIQEAIDRAWVIREKIVKRVQGVPVTENSKKIWESTIEDVEEGSCLGPFFNQGQITEVVGTDRWIPTQRFEVVQKNKVRGCDSATTNLINRITVITENLQLPSTDSNVAALRALRARCPWAQLAGWVLDERKAYRQVAVLPEHRRFSVICLRDPCSGKVAFFVMVGHSFGLVSAVYNYNRRSAAINEILVKEFGLVAFSFYDDKYGFEPKKTVQSAHRVAQAVHWWLGARYDQKKLQLSLAPTILGVTFNLERMLLEIKEDRKKDLIEEIDALLEANLLDPGTAGKLKGKLMFGASQLWGKLGRAFLRVISERQYSRFPVGDGFTLDRPLREALLKWKFLIREGPPRPIEMKVDKTADVVIFTDGFTPDPRSNDTLPDRIGAVLFDRRLACPRQFTSVVAQSVKKRWLQRKTQIVPVEMVAPIVAVQTFNVRLRNCDLILLIDSEAVEGSLIKGYSSREDLCSLVSVFWDLIFHFQIRVFIDRIATDANPADWPSRNDLKTGEGAGWTSVEPVWPTALKG